MEGTLLLLAWHPVAVDDFVVVFNTLLVVSVLGLGADLPRGLSPRGLSMSVCSSPLARKFG